jgi:hypothetical protein
MKNTLKNLAVLLLLLGLALGLTAFRPATLALQESGDRLVLGGNFVLREGETLDGNLIVMGGNATLEAGSRVERDVVILGGNLLVRGVVGGDVNVIGGLATLEDGAIVEGDVNSLSGQLLLDEGAQVEGNINDNVTLPFYFSAPARITIPNINGELPFPFTAQNRMDWGLRLIAGILWWLGRSFIWAILALLVGLFLPNNTQRAAAAATAKPLVAGGLGCLTILVAPALILLLLITICGIPIGLLGLFLLLAAWAFGIIALGLETGKRLAELLKQDWVLPVSAMVGTFMLTLLVNGLGALIPCVGWMVPAVVGAVGLGAALVTRFGAEALPETEGLPPSSASAPGVETLPLPAAPPESPAIDLPAVENPPPDEQA